MMSAFGEYVHKIRTERGVTQRDLAAAAGVDFTYISKVENGVVPPPSHDTTVKIAKRLGEDPIQMLVLAGHVPQAVREYLLSDARIMIAVARLADAAVGPDVLEKMVEIVQLS